MADCDNEFAPEESRTAPALVNASVAVQVESSAQQNAAAVFPARRSRSYEREGRVAAQPGFVLHSYPYKETSLIIYVFSRDHGRVALIAMGAMRPHSILRGVLQTFQPLSVGWNKKTKKHTKNAAEWV